MVEIYFEDTEILDLDPEFFVLWFSKVTKLHNKKMGSITLIFCSDEYLLDINKQYLEHDYYTDIITFNYNEKDVVSGDLFVSLDRIRDNAAAFKQTEKEELLRVVIHGVLHLIGFNDKTDEEEVRMRALEEEAIELIVSRET